MCVVASLFQVSELPCTYVHTAVQGGVGDIVTINIYSHVLGDIIIYSHVLVY